MAAMSRCARIVMYSAWGPEGSLAVPAYPVAYLEGRDIAADRFDFPRKFRAQDHDLRPGKPAEEPQQKRNTPSISAIRPVDGRRPNLDQQLVVTNRRLVHFLDLDDVRRPVPGSDRCSHGWGESESSRDVIARS